MGRLYARIEARDPASDSFRKAIAEYERMRAEPSTEPADLEHLVETLVQLSDNEYARAHWKDGDEPLQRALLLLEPVAAGNARRVKMLAHLEDKLGYGAANGGDSAGAEAHARRGLVHLDAVLKLQPREPSHLAMLCHTYNNLGAMLVAQGRLAEAEANARALIARIETLRHDEAAKRSTRFAFLQAIAQLLDILYRQHPTKPPGDLDDWHRRYDAALAELADAAPPHLGDLPIHCDVLTRTYDLHVQNQWFGDARALAQRAYAGASRLAATAPTDALLGLTLGRAALKLGEAHQREHADDDARAAYGQAHAAVKPWFQHDTMGRDFRFVGTGVANVGLLLRTRRHTRGEVLDPFQQALALAPPDLKPSIHINLARTYCDTSAFDDAEREVERSSPPNPMVRCSLWPPRCCPSAPGPPRTTNATAGAAGRRADPTSRSGGPSTAGPSAVPHAPRTPRLPTPRQIAMSTRAAAARIDCPRCRRSRSVRPSTRDASEFRCLRCNHAFRAPEAVSLAVAPSPPPAPIVSLPILYSDDTDASAEPPLSSATLPLSSVLLSSIPPSSALPSSVSLPIPVPVSPPRDLSQLTDGLALGSFGVSNLSLFACWMPSLTALRLMLAALGLFLSVSSLTLASFRPDSRPRLPTAALAVGLSLLVVWIAVRI